MKSFFKEAVGSLKTTGTIRPSSSYLIQSCLQDVDFTRDLTIVEFGTGNGCITEEIASRMTANSRLLSFEINPKFFEFSTRRFKDQPNVSILNESALDIDRIVQEHGIHSIDHCISSLPLALFSPGDVQELLDKIKLVLDDQGVFVQYQYSLRNYRTLTQYFDKVRVGFTLRNVPPAFIYRCH